MISDDFWSGRLKTVAENTLPSMYDLLVKTGRWAFYDQNWEHLDIQPHHFWDSDIAKFLEAVCYTLKYTEKADPNYEKYAGWIDDIVGMTKRLQMPDGYINSFFSQIRPGDIFTNIMEMHELYCCGHLLEAAIAHHEATGSRELLDTLCRYIDLLCDKFGPGEKQLQGYPGHEELELALVKLIAIVPEERYKQLLTFFVEERGRNGGEFFADECRRRGVDPDTYVPLELEGDVKKHVEKCEEKCGGGGTGLAGDTEVEKCGTGSGSTKEDLAWPAPRSYWYYQAHCPVREQQEALGHSVRVVYFLTGVQGLAMLKKDPSLAQAVRALFDNIIDKKFYVHGGIGSEERWEGFGENYELRWDGYSETCASVGLVMLCAKMLERQLDKKVALAMERALYNNVLGGVSLDGRSYYYDQPVTGLKGLRRQSWFVCSCCPPNVARLFASLDKYAISDYAVHLYIGMHLKSHYVDFKVTTKYPFKGEVELAVKSGKEFSFSIREPDAKYTASEPFEVKNGYLVFEKKVWDATVKVDFDILVEVLKADPKVDANRGCLAVKRGPFVYALQKSGSAVPLDDVTISKRQKFTETKESLQGVEYIALKTDVHGKQVTFVPYFITGNETPGEDFRMWIREDALKACELM